MRNNKTSTAALDSVHQRPRPELRRVPRHLSGARRRAEERSNESSRGKEQQFQQARILVGREDVMNTPTRNSQKPNVRTILPVILRITLSLILWTLGAGMTMKLEAEPVKEHRAVYTFAVDRAQVEDLQRWVNAGHDLWCRDPQLVAVASLRRISKEFEEFEAASLPLELEHRQRSEAVYTFHSLDGRATYRITLRRYDWLLATAGSLQGMIWVPEKAEIVKRDTLD
jgi:hypothetical protein